MSTLAIPCSPMVEIICHLPQSYVGNFKDKGNVSLQECLDKNESNIRNIRDPLVSSEEEVLEKYHFYSKIMSKYINPRKVRQVLLKRLYEYISYSFKIF